MSAFDDEPIHVTVPGSPDDPRATGVPSGVVPHHMPALHPDDVTIVRGVPVTSLARTLVDLAEVLTRDELREAFAQAQARGILDMAAVEAADARLEWRPSLGMLHDVMDEFVE
jgi:predicted transcriptional regulator of viral defense system